MHFQIKCKISCQQTAIRTIFHTFYSFSGFSSNEPDTDLFSLRVRKFTHVCTLYQPASDPLPTAEELKNGTGKLFFPRIPIRFTVNQNNIPDKTNFQSIWTCYGYPDHPRSGKSHLIPYIILFSGHPIYIGTSPGGLASPVT